MQHKHQYLSYLGAILSFFVPYGRHAAVMGMKFDMEQRTMPYFTLISVVYVWGYATHR